MTTVERKEKQDNRDKCESIYHGDDDNDDCDGDNDVGDDDDGDIDDGDDDGDDDNDDGDDGDDDNDDGDDNDVDIDDGDDGDDDNDDGDGDGPLLGDDVTIGCCGREKVFCRIVLF